MLKSALITAATVVALTVGALGAAHAETSRAPAPTAVDWRGGDDRGAPGWHGNRSDNRGWNGPRGYGERHVRGPVRVCKPILRTVKVRGHHGWRFERVVVGERCHFVRRGW